MWNFIRRNISTTFLGAFSALVIFFFAAVNTAQGQPVPKGVGPTESRNCGPHLRVQAFLRHMKASRFAARGTIDIRKDGDPLSGNRMAIFLTEDDKFFIVVLNPHNQWACIVASGSKYINKLK